MENMHHHQHQIQFTFWTDTVDISESLVTEICFHPVHSSSCKTVDSYVPTLTFWTVVSTLETLIWPHRFIQREVVPLQRRNRHTPHRHTHTDINCPTQTHAHTQRPLPAGVQKLNFVFWTAPLLSLLALWTGYNTVSGEE